MRALDFSAAVLLLFPFLVLVHGSLHDCPDACQIPFSRVLFRGSSANDTFYVGQCTNRLRVQSIFYCMKEYCNSDEIDAGLRKFSDTCRRHGYVELLPWADYSNFTLDDIRFWKQIELKDLGNGIIHNSSVYVSDRLFSLSFKTSTAWTHELDMRVGYGYAMVGFFIAVMLVSKITRFIGFIEARLIVQGCYGGYQRPSALKVLSLVTKRYLTTPALFTYHVAQPVGWFTIPQRLLSLTIVAFTIINIIFCVSRYDLFEDNLYWPSPQLQFWRYVSDRTGILSMTNLPLMFAFGMRNNVLSWLTGWDYSTCNMFHRWIARVATIEAVVHSIGYTVFCFINGGMAEYLEQWAFRYWWMGAIATVAMSLLCVLSVYPIRQRCYELFLALHGSLSILFLIGMWYHVAIFEGQYNPLIWPCIGIWVSDRFLRIVRRLYLNSRTPSATATYNVESDIIRIKASVWSRTKPQPGTFYFIYDLDDKKPWESHPFTLSTWETDVFNKNQHTVTFIVRPYEGYTARLQQRIISMQPGVCTLFLSSTSKAYINMSIEGTYGHAHNLYGYNSILFIVGGTGITVALSHLQAISEALQQKSRILTQNIRLIWAVRSEALYQDICNHELSKWLGLPHITDSVSLTIEVYITKLSRDSVIKTPFDNALVSGARAGKPNASKIISYSSTQQIIDVDASENDSLLKTAGTSSDGKSEEHVRIIACRPRIHELVQEAASAWATGEARLAVVNCGPAAMADDTRAAVVAAYARGHESLDLMSETFTW